jgi:hypothetical protein
VPWEPVEVVKLAWSRFERFWVVPVVAYLIQTVITQVATRVPVLAIHLDPNPLRSHTVGRAVLVLGAFFFVTWVLTVFFTIGTWRISLDVARNREPRLGALFSGGDRFLPMLGVYALMGLAFVAGFILLIVPAFWTALAFSQAPLYVVDANMGPIEAMKASMEATKGQKGDIVVLGLLVIGIAIAGLLACCVGVLPASALVYVALAAAYTRMSGIEPAMSDPGSY